MVPLMGVTRRCLFGLGVSLLTLHHSADQQLSMTKIIIHAFIHCKSISIHLQYFGSKV